MSIGDRTVLLSENKACNKIKLVIKSISNKTEIENTPINHTLNHHERLKMHLMKKCFYINITKIEKRNFVITVKESLEGLKPSALRIKTKEKKNFNDIINKYYPNRVLKNKKKEESKKVNPNEMFFLSSRIKRLIESKEKTKNTDSCSIITSSQKEEKLKEKNDNELITNETKLDTERKSSEVLPITKEEHDVQKYKNRLHKKIWLSLKKNNEREFEHYFNILNKYHLKDEVSYSILLHGNLIIWKGQNIKESFNILEEMKKNKVHCSLIRFNERLLYSYYELLKVNAPPNFHQWIKVLRTVWFTSALVKARRQRFILRKIKNIKKDNSVSLNNFNNIFNIHNLQTLYIDKKDPLLPTHVNIDKLSCGAEKYLK